MSVVEEILPIGALLSNLSVQTPTCEDEAGFHLIVLTFKPTQYLVLRPLANKEQISISPFLSYERKRVIHLLTNPNWAQPLIGKKLDSVWLDNDEGDRHQIVFTFDEVQPRPVVKSQGNVHSHTLSFSLKNSVLKLSLQEQIETKKIPLSQKSQVGRISLLKKYIPLLG